MSLDAGIGAEALGGFRLSPQQRRVWLLQQAGGPLAYHVQCASLIQGDIDAGALLAALQAVASRYEILRTAFRCVPGMSVPLQVVRGAAPPVLEVRDLRHLGPEEAAADELLGEIERTSFDLERGPVLHGWLARLGTGRSLLVLRAPALCLDRIGLGKVLEEVARACAGMGEEEEPAQYADLAEWQNGLLESEDAAADREAWRHRGLSTLDVALPFESRAAGSEPFDPREVAAELDPALAAAVEGLAERSGVGVEILLFAMWGVLLARLTGRSEVVIGARFNGRSYEGLEDVPGLFARTLPLRFRLEEDWTLLRLLQQVSQEFSEAREVQEYFSWEAALGSEADAPLAPGTRFAPFGFELQEPAAGMTIGEARLEPFRESSCIERFTVSLVARWGAGRHRLEIRYDASRLEADDARRLAAQIEALVRRLTVAGKGPVRKLDVLSEAERRQLLGEVNETRLQTPAAGCIHRWFEEQVERVPERLAVVLEDRSLTYRELNLRANRLAHFLRALGVGPDDRVALCLDRSLEMVVALLGVLKAGGAYLPLDPQQPRQRLALMFGESAAKALVTEERFLPLFPDLGVPVLCLDREEDLARLSSENPSGGAEPENLAYVLFTSGSTGVPKGVAVEHRQLLNYVVGAIHRLDLPPGGSFSTVSTFGADLGNTMIFPALCTGGCLHVVANERVSDPERFAEYAESRGIDCLKIVPSHLRALLTADRPEGVVPRKRLVLGGEALGWDLVGHVRELRPECEVFNHYGPTETTVGVLAGRVPGERRWALAATVPLGRPLANSQVYLLDSELRPVPTWVTGELYIGGAGLARGYLGRPDLTAARFVPHPLGVAGERLYRTGDLARWLPDGTVEFLGRADGQIKIRGFRIETGEVEALLRQQPKVREAVVLARHDDQGEARLVAYVVPDRQQPPAQGELRVYLSERLPDAMVPSAFVLLKALPLNSNGKVDRGALPAPNAVHPELDAAFVPPRTEMERAIAQVWQEVLHLEKVGLHDNFFDLGGHSLLLVQTSAGLRKVFEREIPMIELFKRTTIASLASYFGQEAEEVVPGRQDEVERAEARKDSLQRQREMRQRRRPAVAG